MSNRSINRVTLLGNIGKDAETKSTPSGVSVTRFSVATSRRWKDQQTNEWKEEVNWTSVVLWRQDNLAQFLTKGKQVFVEGRLQTRSYDDKDNRKVTVTEVIAEDVILLGGRSDAQEPNNAAPRRAAGQSAAGRTTNEDPFGGMGVTDDDVPF